MPMPCFQTEFDEDTVMDDLKQWPHEPEKIKTYLCDLWHREYPDQGCLPFYYSWVRRSVPLSHIVVGKPSIHPSQEKVDEYIAMLFSGKKLPPLVCLYGDLVDGYHRYLAYREVGVFTDSIEIYANR